jgi:hypothetical protein
MKSKSEAIVHQTTGKRNRPATSSPATQSSVAKSWGIYLPNGGAGPRTTSRALVPWPRAPGRRVDEDDEPWRWRGRRARPPGVPCARAVPVRRRFGGEGRDGAGRAAPCCDGRGGLGRRQAGEARRRRRAQRRCLGGVAAGGACRVPMCVVGWGWGGLVVARLVDDERFFFLLGVGSSPFCACRRAVVGGGVLLCSAVAALCCFGLLLFSSPPPFGGLRLFVASAKMAWIISQKDGCVDYNWPERLVAFVLSPQDER